MNQPPNDASITRRAVLKTGMLALVTTGPTARALASLAIDDPLIKPLVRFGVLTDVHYADKAAAGTRHYRDSLAKLRASVAGLNEADVEFAVELGDFIDAAGGTVEAEIEYLTTIERAYEKLDAERHYVLGNHCVHTLTKDEFADNSGLQQPYHSFDSGGVHFVVLDACYRADGEAYQRGNFHWQDTAIPQHELDWLKDDLTATDLPTIVFAHQRIDETEHHSVKNAAQVRTVLEDSGRVLAVFQGHSHENAHIEQEGIHYCVVRGMVEGAGMENSGYGIVDVFPDRSLIVHGYVQQETHKLSPVATADGCEA